MRKLTWVALHCWYYNFSKKYQATIERKYRSWGLPEHDSLTDLSATVGRMRWRKDSYMELWDAISDPRATFAKHSMGLKAGDCDDISLYAANRIEDMRKRGVLENVRTVGLLSIPWIGKKGKVAGHNICAFSYVLKDVGLCWAHISNWYNGHIRFQDFNGQHFATVEEIVTDVLKGRTSIGWSFADTKLQPIRSGDGKGL